MHLFVQEKQLQQLIQISDTDSNVFPYAFASQAQVPDCGTAWQPKTSTAALSQATPPEDSIESNACEKKGQGKPTARDNASIGSISSSQVINKSYLEQHALGSTVKSCSNTGEPYSNAYMAHSALLKFTSCPELRDATPLGQQEQQQPFDLGCNVLGCLGFPKEEERSP